MSNNVLPSTLPITSSSTGLLSLLAEPHHGIVTAALKKLLVVVDDLFYELALQLSVFEGIYGKLFGRLDCVFTYLLLSVFTTYLFGRENTLLYLY